jgi:hypothetical protein
MVAVGGGWSVGLCVFLLGVVRVMGVVSCFCGWLVRGSPGRVPCVFFYSGLAGSCALERGCYGG